MLYYMSSTTFFKLFLRNESDQDILKTQYVLGSLKIRSGGKFKNVITAPNILFPNPDVLVENVKGSGFENAYYSQLESNIAFLATIVLGSLKENFNVVFICSKKESRIKYFELLANFIYTKFKYPLYNYKDYVLNKYELIKYDPKKVLKLCKKYLKKAEKDSYVEKITGGDIDVKDFKKKPKVMKRILKDNGYYWKGMKKEDMLEMIELMSYNG